MLPNPVPRLNLVHHQQSQTLVPEDPGSSNPPISSVASGSLSNPHPWSVSHFAFLCVALWKHFDVSLQRFQKAFSSQLRFIKCLPNVFINSNPLEHLFQAFLFSLVVYLNNVIFNCRTMLIFVYWLYLTGYWLQFDLIQIEVFTLCLM